MMLNQDPQNPYQSYMVEASAGTGKTYQLTRRFLYLVGAGADPSEILAITFTVKAVGEMQARIIAEASELLTDKEYQKSFDAKLKSFYRDLMASKPEDYTFPAPRTSEETARLVLTSTQRLKICTIDSIFYEWVMKFPMEASPDNFDNNSFLRSLNLTESYDNERISQLAWDYIFKNKESKEIFETSYEVLKKCNPKLGILGVQKQIEELYRYRLHVFHVEKKTTDVFQQYALNLKDKFYKKTAKSVISSLQEELLSVAAKTSKAEVFTQLILKGDLQGLTKNRLLTKQGLVSKALIRGKKREELCSEISSIESYLSSFYCEKAKFHLNEIGDNLFSIYKIWNEERNQVKKKLMLCDFSDLSVGCHNLFSKEDNSSVLWLLQKSIHHLLIDEFQDTSMVQWDIFSSLSEEILSSFESSSDHKAYKTAFLVGDRKQSIYGFREADPYVMSLSSEFFKHYNKEIVSLNKSYRTTPLIMDFLTRFFSEKIDKNFPVHETGLKPSGHLAVPNVSKVMISDLFVKSDDSQLSPLEKEALNLADFLSNVFEDPKKFPIFDKDSNNFRPIRYSDICVLYRNATHADTFTEALSRKNIPFRREGEISFFESPTIDSILSLFKFFVDPSDILSLVVFLKSHLFSVPEFFILEALDETRDIDSLERVDQFFSILSNKGIFLDELLSVREKAFFLLPHELLSRILKKVLRIEKNDEDSDSKNSLSQKLLMSFLDLILRLEKKGCLTLHSCLQEIEKIASTFTQSLQDDFVDSVSFMTIHKSKGLEFPFVCLIESSDSWFKFDRYWIKSEEGVHYCGTYDKMPHEDPSFQSVYKKASQTFYEETIRLLYVAMTRASQYLFLSAHSSNSVSRETFHEKMLNFLNESCPDKKKNGALTYLEKGCLDVVFKEGNPEVILSAKVPLPLNFSTNTFDIRILNPHEALEDPSLNSDSKEKSLKDERLSSLLGTFIHKVFDLTIEKKKFSIESLWSSLVLSSPIFLRKNYTEKSALALFSEVDLEIKKTLNSEFFKSLFENLEEVQAEYSLVYLDGKSLIKGSLDLFVKYKSKNILILDYKTSSVPSEANLKDFCQKKSYDKQLFWYSRALKKLYPDYIIETAIWLTKRAELVRL